MTHLLLDIQNVQTFGQGMKQLLKIFLLSLL